VQNFQFDPYQKQADGSYKTNKKGERIRKKDKDIEKESRLAAEAAVNLADWAEYHKE
jgi:hypothetical protein